jgi:5'(3')-deoxyribonucleotidase
MFRTRGAPDPVRIAVDMDEVLADALGELIVRYNREFRDGLTRESLTGKWLAEAIPPERQNRLAEYLHAPDFFEDLSVIPESQRVVERLSHHCEIFVASAAMEFPNSLGAKYRWLQRHFPFVPYSHYVFCGDKSILSADYLIDDMPRHFERFRGQGLLFTSPHNANLRGYSRVDDWRAVERYFYGH